MSTHPAQFAGRLAVAEHGATGHLVDGVVAAHVLAYAPWVAGRIKQAGGVQPARSLERGLRLSQAVRQPGDDRRRHGVGRAHHRGTPAPPGRCWLSRRCRSWLPTGSGRAGASGSPAAAELNGDRVEAPFRVAHGVAVPHSRDLRRTDQAFGDQKSGRQLEVVTGGSHGDGDRHGHLTRAGGPDLEGLLGRQLLGEFHPAIGPNLDGADRGHWPGRRGHRGRRSRSRSAGVSTSTRASGWPAAGCHCSGPTSRASVPSNRSRRDRRPRAASTTARSRSRAL